MASVQKVLRTEFYKNLPLANSIRFNDLNRHFTAKSTVALLVAIDGVMLLVPQTRKKSCFLSSSSNDISFVSVNLFQNFCFISVNILVLS
jgi:hypothetical protein